MIAIRASLAVKQGLVGFNAADIFLPTLLATSSPSPPASSPSPLAAHQPLLSPGARLLRRFLRL